MRADWQTGQLGDFFEIVTGGTPPKAKKEMYGSYMPLVKPPELTGTGVHWSKDFLSEKGAAASRVLPVGSVLVSCIGNLGKIGISKVELATNQQINSIKPNAKKAFPEFIFYLVKSPYFIDQLNTLTSGTTVPIVNKSKFKSILVALPTLSEQKRIVAILDEAFAGIDTAIANTEKNLANARELFESYLDSVFTKNESSWHKFKLESICKKITVGHVGSMANRYKAEGIPLLRSQNIRPFRVDLDKVVFIDEEFHGELKKSALKPGDLGIVRTGYPGTAAVIPESLAVANCSDLVIVRPGDQVLSDFLAIVFNSYYGKQAVAGVLVGAAQKHFNVTAAKAALIPLPSLEEQKRFVAECGYIRSEHQRLEAIYQQKLTALAELKQSLLQKAFSGELTADKAASPSILKEEELA